MEGAGRGAVEQEPADIPDQAPEAVAEAEGRSRVRVRVTLGGDVVGGVVVGLTSHGSVRLRDDRRGGRGANVLEGAEDECAVPAHIVALVEGNERLPSQHLALVFREGKPTL